MMEYSEQAQAWTGLISLGVGREYPDRARPGVTNLSAPHADPPIRFSITGLERMMTHHEVGTKDGKFHMLGCVNVLENAEVGVRTKKNVHSMCLAGLDLDSGDRTLDEIRSRVEEMNVVAFVYSTHSHLQDKGGKIGERYRIIFPLAEPFIVAGDKDAMNEWAERLLGLGRLLDVTPDEAALDVSRLFYLPRHRPNAPFVSWTRKGGDLLDIRSVERVRRERGKRRRRGADNPFSAFGEAHSRDDGDEVKGDLIRWAAVLGNRFDAVEWLEEYAPDTLTGEDHDGKAFTVCPHLAYAGHHSTSIEETPHGSYVASADPGGEEGEGFTWHCSHDSCAHLDRLDRLACLMSHEDIQVDALFDARFLIQVEGDPEPAEYLRRFRARPSFSEEEDEDTEIDAAEIEEYADLPEGFRRADDGSVYFMVIEKDDDGKPFERPVFVCSDIGVVGRTRNEEEEGWCVTVEFPDEGGHRHAVDVPIHDLIADERKTIAELAGKGLRVGTHSDRKPGVGSSTHLTARMLLATDCPRLSRKFSRPGWHGAEFVCPNGEIVGEGDVRGKRLAAEATMQDPTKAGSLEGWQAAVDAACASGNDHFVIGVIAGCAGTILQLAGVENCALNLSGKSSRGKTTAQRLGASCWGNPRTGKGLVRSMRTTLNAAENYALLSTGTALIMDEMALADQRQVSQLVFQLASGVGKGRMSLGGGMQHAATWNTFCLMSSERTIGEVVRDANRGKNAESVEMLAGQAVRCPDIDVTGALDLDAATMAAVEDYYENYGHAGPELVRFLHYLGYVDDPSLLKDRIIDCAGAISGGDATPIQRRAATVFALLNVTGNVMQEAGLLPGVRQLSVDEMIDRLWTTFVGSEDSGIGDPIERGCERFRAWVASNIKSRIVECGAEPRGEVSGWFSKDNDTLYIPKDIMRIACGGGVNVTEVVKRLRDEGILTMQGTHLYHTRIPSSGTNVKHHRFTLSSLVDVEGWANSAEEDMREAGKVVSMRRENS